MSKRKRDAPEAPMRTVRYYSDDAPNDASKTVVAECVLRRAVAAGRLTAADGDWLLAALAEPKTCCARECVASGADCVVCDGGECNLQHTIVNDCIRPFAWSEETHAPAVCARGACANCHVGRACTAHADALRALACVNCGKWLCVECVVARCTRVGPHGFREMTVMEVTCDDCLRDAQPAKRAHA